MDGSTRSKVEDGRIGSDVSGKTTKKKKPKKIGDEIGSTTSSSGVSKKIKASSKKKAKDGGNRIRSKSSRSLQNGNGDKGRQEDDDDQDEVPTRRKQRQQQYQPLQLHELPDADELVASVTKDLRSLKLECKRLFEELERDKRETDAVMEEALKIKRKSQIEKLRGNELIKVDHLLRMGFDADIIRDHLKAENKLLEKECRTRQLDIKNLESNISKMTAMNKECEKAVTAAHGAFGPFVVRQQALQAKLQQAELELYSMETKVKHKRNMKSVEFTSKDKFKHAMKEIVKEVQGRCEDGKLTRDVLKVAGQTMSTDLGIADKKSDYSSDDSDDKSSASSTSGSNLSSVEVSSVEVEVSSSESDG